jgi:serine phosphatase RsbU (regulator of sigma subunit)
VLDADSNPNGPRTRAEDAAQRLRELEFVTDTTIGQLSVADLLAELLRRVRAILDADTAAVLLLDEAKQQLVATAAAGLEEEVRESVHVPVGTGFAGRIAQLRRPVALNRVDETTVANPILWEKGIRVMLGVPLLVGDDVLGVLHVGRLRNQPFDQQDEELLEVVAERVTGATQSRQLAVERAAASLLEHSLLPGRLPAFAGLELAARYITPEDRMVGGDWYDVFGDPDGNIWVVTGDVAGHGLDAAVVMGRARSALRAYTLIEDAPEKVLELTDRKIQHFEVGTMVTAVCATSRPPYEDWRVAIAGHPPPIVAAPGVPSRLTELPVDPPLGGPPGTHRSAGTVTLAQDALMLLYTDGLIERRGESLGTGLDRLCRSLRSGTPELVCGRVVHELIGAEGPGDDVALLAVRRAHRAS